MGASDSIVCPVTQWFVMNSRVLISVSALCASVLIVCFVLGGSDEVLHEKVLEDTNYISSREMDLDSPEVPARRLLAPKTRLDSPEAAALLAPKARLASLVDDHVDPHYEQEDGALLEYADEQTPEEAQLEREGEELVQAQVAADANATTGPTTDAASAEVKTKKQL